MVKRAKRLFRRHYGQVRNTLWQACKTFCTTGFKGCLKTIQKGNILNYASMKIDKESITS